MSLYNYTTLHDLRDICSIYRGNWKVKFWNFTDSKYEHIGFVRVIDEPEMDHPVALFRTTQGSTRIEFTQGIRDELAPYWCTEYEYAEVVVVNHDNGEMMKICFTGSINSHDEDREVHYNIDYMDENFHKWKRDLRWFWFKIKYKFKKIFNIC